MHAPQSPKARSAFDLALYAAQTGSTSEARRLFEDHGAWVIATAKGIARRLGVPKMEVEDIAQETLCRLLDPAVERFDPSRGSAKQYIRGIVLNAVGFSGRRRRTAREACGHGREASSHAPVADGTVHREWRRAFRRTEARLDAEALLRLADPMVRRAVILVYLEEMSQRTAAAEIGVSEFKLCRTLKEFYASARAAA
jgi:RNA polymerase sigma factor (sigma-70 family)